MTFGKKHSALGTGFEDPPFEKHIEAELDVYSVTISVRSPGNPAPWQTKLILDGSIVRRELAGSICVIGDILWAKVRDAIHKAEGRT